MIYIFFFFKQKTAYEMRISDWSSDVCSSDLDENALASEALRRVEQESSTWLVADLARHIATLLPPGVAANAIEHVDVIDRIAVRGAARCLELAPDHEGPYRRRSEEHTSELQSLMRTSYAVFCLKNKQQSNIHMYITP